MCDVPLGGRQLAVLTVGAITFLVVVADVFVVALPRAATLLNVYGLGVIGVAFVRLLTTHGVAITLRQAWNMFDGLIGCGTRRGPKHHDRTLDLAKS